MLRLASSKGDWTREKRCCAGFDGLCRQRIVGKTHATTRARANIGRHQPDIADQPSSSGLEPTLSVVQGTSWLAQDLPVSSRLEPPLNFHTGTSCGNSAKDNNWSLSADG